MSSLRAKLQLLNEMEINKALEAYIVEKNKLSNQETDLIVANTDLSLTDTQKAENKAKLTKVQDKLENKQKEIDLIRAVSSEEIHAQLQQLHQDHQTQYDQRNLRWVD